MESILKNRVVLVTGGTGSIGSEIVRYCLEQGVRRVIVFSRDEIKHFLLRRRLRDERLESVIGDTREASNMEGIFSNSPVDIIYHAAAMKHVVMCEESPRQAVETNVLGTHNVVDLALRYKVSKMIAISSDKAAYPVNVMGATKFITERIMLNANRVCDKNQVFSCVRFGNVAISRGSVIPVFVSNLLNGNPLLVTDKEVTRFVMQIPEVVKLVTQATLYARGGEIFLPKMKAFRLGDLLEVVVDRIAPRLGIKSQDIELKVTGLIKGEKLHEDLINKTEAGRIHELDDMYAILESEQSAAKYREIKKVALPEYTSRNVPLISKDEIEKTVLDYLQNYLAVGRN